MPPPPPRVTGAEILPPDALDWAEPPRPPPPKPPRPPPPKPPPKDTQVRYSFTTKGGRTIQALVPRRKGPPPFGDEALWKMDEMEEQRRASGRASGVALDDMEAAAPADADAAAPAADVGAGAVPHPTGGGAVPDML